MYPTRIYDYSTYDFSAAEPGEARFKMEFSRKVDRNTYQTRTFNAPMEQPLEMLLESFSSFCAKNREVVDEDAERTATAEIRIYKAEFSAAYNHKRRPRKMTSATATRTAIGNPRFYSTVTTLGDYTAHYRTGRQTAKKITLTNLPAITEYARSVREDETPGEARRQLWNLYHDLKAEAAVAIEESFRSFPPATDAPDELRTAILADYSRAVIVAIGDDEEGGNE